MNILNVVKTYVLNLWDAGKIKVNLVSLGVLFFTLTVMVVWVAPNEKAIDTQINQKYNTIAAQYDEATHTYADPKEVSKLQSEANGLENKKQLTKIVNVVSYSTILIALVGLLATLLQHIFTDLKFIKKSANDELNQHDVMKVLAAALFSTALIVGIVFYVVFVG